MTVVIANEISLKKIYSGEQLHSTMEESHKHKSLNIIIIIIYKVVSHTKEITLINVSWFVVTLHV